MTTHEYNHSNHHQHDHSHSDAHSNHHQHDHDFHGHGHHHHSHALPVRDGRLSRVFYWAMGLNLGYVLLEAGFGLSSGSMGLLSDAGHNLSDVASLLIALLAFKAARRPATPRFSYGYGKATIEASLANAVILYVAIIFIIIESIERLLHPELVNGDEIAWVAGIGVIINGVTAWMLLRESGHDLNVKGAYLHMAADTLVSVGVVISGIIISFTGWTWLDPAVGLAIAAVIAIGSWSLLRDSMRLALDGVPHAMDIRMVEKVIAGTSDVESFHHLHVWALSTTDNALTVHVIVKDPMKIDGVIESLRQSLKEIGIAHSTIEAETRTHSCGHSGCDLPPQK